MTLPLSVLIFSLASLYGLHMWFRFQAETREHRDTVKLAKILEDRIKGMDDLKARMESLLIKQGLGR